MVKRIQEEKIYEELKKDNGSFVCGDDGVFYRWVQYINTGQKFRN